MRRATFAAAILVAAIGVSDAAAKTILRFHPTTARVGDRVVLDVRSHLASGRHSTGFTVYLVRGSFVNQALYPPAGAGHRRNPLVDRRVSRIGAVTRSQTQLSFVVPRIPAGRYVAMVWCRCGEPLDASVATTLNDGMFVPPRAVLVVRR